MRPSLAAITVNLGGGVWRTVASSPACQRDRIPLIVGQMSAHDRV